MDQFRVSVILTDQSPYHFWHPFFPLIDIPKGFSSKRVVEVVRVVGVVGTVGVIREVRIV